MPDIFRDLNILDARGETPDAVTGVFYDSRRVTPGSLFVAVRGFKTDGHDYIVDAVKNGAALVICERPPGCDVPYILVDDSRRALAQASRNFYGRPDESMKIIGITGTNGKTTTTYLMKTLLEKTTGAKVGLVGTIQNMIGDEIISTERTTPESTELFELFARMRDAGCAYAVMEVSSHSLVLDRVYGVEFETGVFTNLTQDHLDFHGTMENYLAAKGELFKRSKNAIINLDDPASEYFINQATRQVFTYSAEKNEADLVAKGIRLDGNGIAFEALTGDSIVRMELKIPGRFSVYNALAAILSAMTAGIKLDAIAAELPNCRGVPGRFEPVDLGTGYSIIIDYAHTPDGVANVLKAARGFTKGRLITVMGCGGDRDRTKRPIMGEYAAKLSDIVIITSDNPRTEDPETIIGDIMAGIKNGQRASVETITDRKRAFFRAAEIARPGDTVMLLGKGHETYQEINGVKYPFDEREEIAKAVGEAAQR